MRSLTQGHRTVEPGFKSKRWLSVCPLIYSSPPLSVCCLPTLLHTTRVCTFECMLSFVHALEGRNLNSRMLQKPQQKAMCVHKRWLLELNGLWRRFSFLRWFSSFSWKDSLKVTFDQVMSKAEVGYLGLSPCPGLSARLQWSLMVSQTISCWGLKSNEAWRTCMLPLCFAAAGEWTWPRLAFLQTRINQPWL